MIVVADTCAVLAAYDEDNPDSDGCAHALGAAGLVVVSPLVVAELDHMGTRLFGRAAARSILADLRSRARILRAVVPEVGPEVLDRAEVIRDRYCDLDLDLADAVNVVLADVYSTEMILTTDRRDFRAVRPLGKFKAFKLLPDDA
ncbi:PIN domain-containing protein [Streptomyces sp. CB01373]|uniref:PIN domain-containing protein n=1 Tax=Streptomyces sp. CB01373 TaxID=2020325 RepID=UPI000C2762E6|nr:PIN domain-containing protein [Streptomyces sp. CB01373]PJM97075.1 VapC toxin family PIN domain ribonuclease [Streptomyces sp. CB01373]